MTFSKAHHYIPTQIVSRWKLLRTIYVKGMRNLHHACTWPLTFDPVSRYKMIWTETWPNYKWTDEEATRKLIEFLHLNPLVKYGKTKIFIRTPKTVYYLEEQREAKLHQIVSQFMSRDSFCSNTQTVWLHQFTSPVGDRNMRRSQIEQNIFAVLLRAQ